MLPVTSVLPGMQKDYWTRMGDFLLISLKLLLLDLEITNSFDSTLLFTREE